MKSLKIALVTHGFIDGGGVASIARFIRESLELRGHSVTVFDVDCSSSSKISRRLLNFKSLFRKSLIVHVRIKESQIFRVGTNCAEFEVARYLPSKELDEHLNQFDVIQVVSGFGSFSNKLKRVKVPIVQQIATRTQWERESRIPNMGVLQRFALTAQYPILNRLEIGSVQRCELTLVENIEMFNWANNLNSGSVSIWNPGVDTSVFFPANKWSPENPFIAIGRLGEPRKGWERLITAFALAIAERSDLPNLRIVGNGDLTHDCYALIDKLQLKERVWVMRNASREELADALKNSSYFLQTSYEEGLGIASLEAMASGLPVISSKSFGSSQVVSHGETGFLIVQDSDFETNFARCLIHAQQLNGAEMARKARRFVEENYQESISINTLQDHYLGVIGYPNE